MAKVSLRVYNREIENLIEGGQIDEALAHCFHILKTFPMHVETYRLLGKAFLEARRYGDAADIFQRVLMAVPDDFVAHVGMSIIRDDEGKLDEAIWHMERAFEVQPSNPAIQGELRRLYGRRDGVEPPKIRLSRDALANMYAQGELFNQAIAEIRAVLAEDTNRPDLEVMLARAYYRGGHKVEAAEMATHLLKKYPYCLDALRILVDVLPGTSRAENTQPYRQRLRMLDPYSAFVTGSLFESDKVADAAVSLERLVYDAGARPPSQADWAASLGIKLEEEKRGESLPDWLSGQAGTDVAAALPEAIPPAEPATSEPLPAAEAEPGPASAGEIPDWLRSAGWGEATGAAQEGPVDFETPEAIAPGEVPDWLKSMAPEGALDEGDTPPVEEPLAAPVPGEIPDWLQPAEQAEPPVAPEPAEEAGPDWLREMSAAAATGAAQELPGGPEEILPDWLRGPAGPESAAAPAEPPPMPPPAEEKKAVLPEETGPVAAPTGPARPLGIEDDTLAWLESLAAKQGANPDELLSRPEERTETPPESVQRLAAAPAEPPPAPPPAEEPKAISPEPAAAAGPTGPARPLEIEDDTLAWLESLAAKQGARPDELLSRPEERTEVPPDSVQRLVEAPPPAGEAFPADAGSLPPAAEAIPPAETDVSITHWLRSLEKEGAGGEEAGPPAPAAEEGLPDWLRDLEQPAGVPAESAALPDWLQSASAEAASAPLQAETPPASAQELPEWLQSAAPPAAETPLPAAAGPAAEQELPDWLADVAAPVAAGAAPVAPDEWVPAVEATQPPPAGEAIQPPPVEEAVQPPPGLPASTPVPTQSRVTGMLARVPAQDKDAELLSAAQQALERGHLNEAMQEYARLIKKARLLDEVIHDLREAIYRFPVDVIVWQTLGDAYMRANRLQEALDAYTKAEELLR